MSFTWSTTSKPTLLNGYYCRACRQVVWRDYTARKVVSYCAETGKHTWIRRRRRLGRVFAFIVHKEPVA